VNPSRSLVAGLNAGFRRRESARPPGARLLDDPYAAAFDEWSPTAAVLRVTRFFVPALARMANELQTAHCVRHRAVDELVRAAARAGYRQVVTIGAGYDMRPARFASQLGATRWFEIDHPATAARKRQRLAGARVAEPPVQRACADLETTGLADTLGRTSFDPAGDAVFVLEGLVHYLSRPTFLRLLADAARGAGRRRLVVTYIRREMAARAPNLFVAVVRLLGEIPRAHFSAGELATLAASQGWRGAQHWSYEQQVSSFAAAARDRPVRLSQDLALFDREGG
jgi:methyltransferase (TIGR00027 family)